MTLIEQAAKRLEQLRQAGVELPDDSSVNPLVTKLYVAPQIEATPEDVHELPKETHSSAQPPVKRIQLNLEAIAASGLLVPHATRSQLADEFRVIKRPLIANAMGKGANSISNGNLIMITSALPGEGKALLRSISQLVSQWN